MNAHITYRLIQAAAITLVLVCLTISFSSVAASAHQGRNWLPCQYEDSKGCVWDAKHRGNGEGRSFKVTKKGKVTFISHKKAHHLIWGHNPYAL